jgi:NifU-like protein involved in Fe-S cluster formation
MDYVEIINRQKQLRFKRPVPAPTFSARGDNPFCGDTVIFSGTLDASGTITALGFTGYACAICEVTSDLLAEFALGKHRDTVLALDSAFGERTLLQVDIPFARKRCAQLALDTLQKALRAVD